MKTIAMEALVHEGQPLGLGLFAKLLLEGLSQQSTDFDFILTDYMFRDFKNRKNNLWYPNSKNFSLDLHYFPRPLMRFFEETLGFKIQNRWMKKNKINLYHGLRGILPPLDDAITRVITVHDLSFKVNSSWYNDDPFTRFDQSLKEANCIVADSAFTAQSLNELCDVDSNKIKVIPLGINPIFKHIENVKQLEDVKSRFKLPDQFILFVGGLRPIKNLPRILEAFAKFNDHGHNEWKLVLTGRKVYGQEPIDKALEKFKLKDKVIFTGYVNQNDLVVLYNLATIFNFTTLHEGFGYPVLEAMACHTAVIASNNTCMPETCGDAALLVDPEDCDAIAQGMKRLADDTSFRNELISKGQKQFLKFPWSRCIQQHLQLYEELLS